MRQGCPLSPMLFNIYAEVMVKEAMEAVPDCVRVGSHVIQAVRFADNQAMTTSTEDGLQRMLTALSNMVEQCRMRINTRKTKVLKVSKRNSPLHIVIN